MVPSLPIVRVTGSGFPRPRGDGPERLGRRVDRQGVPPPTRGWSVNKSFKARFLLGSPAHAGMVPLTPIVPMKMERFPRPRGDGPATPASARFLSAVPPPTRGWSRYMGKLDMDCVGSPAHAGMVPSCHREFLAPKRFPRPRGDGPKNSRVGPGGLKVPPPTRGWSRKARRLC